MSEQRRLAAIVSADVAGYSRLMGRDESGTLAALKALRREIVDPAIASHGGRIVKTTGDGLLLEFPSVVNAVRCAIEVQTAMAAKTAEVPEDRRLAFRVGVNIGDIIADGDDIFGDGVNTAARLQEIAAPGGVCVSARVHEDVRDRLDTAFEDGGPQTLKNIARPVQVWRWSPQRGGSAAPSTAAAPSLALPDKPSIAVLPFQNMSGDPEQEYFADGITEDIITELSRFRSLFVIARNSTFTYKGKAVDVRTVGKELGVRYVLEGSCRKASARVRVTAQLIDASNGNHIWAEHYDRDLHDIFVVQEELTQSIVAAIAPRVEAAELALARRVRSMNLQAHELALRARAQAADALSKASRESRHEAIATAEAALKTDPTCQLALTTLAWLHWQQAWFWTGSSIGESLASAVEAANEAIALDPLDHEPHVHKSFCLAVTREYDGALSEAGLATELNPNAADALQTLGVAQLIGGSPELAIESLLRTLRLNPRDPAHFITHCYLSIACFLATDYRKAVEWGRLSTRAAPHYAIGVGALAQALAGDGQLDAARREIETLRQIAPEFLRARLGGNSPFAVAEHRERQIRLLRLAAGLEASP
jgi:adenylate cyclase